MFMITGMVRGMVVKPLTFFRFQSFASSRSGQHASRIACAFSCPLDIFFAADAVVISVSSLKLIGMGEFCPCKVQLAM
jgi:hypothetical protein